MESSPNITEPHKKPRRLLRTLLMLLLAGFGSFGLILYLAMPKPPTESALIQNFNKNRAAFEQLRDMLEADTNLTRVAGWGVETRNPSYLGDPSASNLPIDRYRRYLALLKQVGGKLASREEGEHGDPSIGLWAWGWAGDTRHIGICWLEEPPSNQVSTLDNYQRQSQSLEQPVAFRHIDEKWYLWSDL